MDLSTERLTGAIRETFPDLAFQTVRRIDSGEDHVVLLLDDQLIFRFPRSAERQVYFAAELRLLAALERCSPVAVPAYRWIAPGEAFGGYRALPGEELRRSRFEALEEPVQQVVMGQLADLLSALHGLPHEVLARADGSLPSALDGASFALRWRENRRAMVSPSVDPGQLARFDRFYDAFAGVRPGPPRVFHADLTDDHLVLAHNTDRLSGVIDFADAAVGDPASDFCFFWSFGDWAPRYLFDRYAFAKADPDLLNRSLWRYARFQIENLPHESGAEKDWRQAQIDRTLTMLGID